MAYQPSRHWHTQERGKVASRLLETVRAIEQRQQRTERIKSYLELLRNRRYSSFDPSSFGIRVSSGQGRLIVNTMRNIYDTLTAHVCTSRPKPNHLPIDGAWSLRYQAKQLDKYILGLFQRERTYEVATLAFRDSLWAELGTVQVWHDGKHVRHERVFPAEIIVDERGAMSGPPSSIYRVRDVPVDRLLEQFPEHAKDITARGIRTVVQSYGSRDLMATDLIQVVSAHHLGYGPEGKGGRWVIAIDGLDLHDEPWPHRWLPYCHIRWTDPEVGFYGQSMVEQQTPMQAAFNERIQKIENATGLNAMRVFYEEGSINPKDVTNDQGGLVPVRKSTTRWPEVHVQGSIPADEYQQTWQLRSMQFEDIGISELSATARRPPAEMPAAAYRFNDEKERHRHGLTLRAWDQFIIDLAERSEQVQRVLFEATGRTKAAYTVHYVRGARLVETVDWADVPGQDEAVLQVLPSALLPTTISGKLATAQELSAAGWIRPDTAMRLLEVPDLERALSTETIYMDYLEYCAEKMLFKGEQMRPQTVMRAYLQLGIHFMGAQLLQAEMEGAPDEAIARVVTWIRLAEGMLQPPTAQPVPPGPNALQPPSPPEQGAVAGMPPQGGLPS